MGSVFYVQNLAAFIFATLSRVASIGEKLMATIDNATQTVITNAPIVNGIDDLLYDISRASADVDSAESFARGSKERLTKLLADLRETGAVLAGDTRTNPTRAKLRAFIAETGLSEQRVKDILSFLTMYYDSVTAVTTLQSNSAVKDSIARQTKDRVIPEGENVVQGTTKKAAKPKKTDAEKALDRQIQLEADYSTKLMSDSIEATAVRLDEHPEFHHLIAFIADTGSLDLTVFHTYMIEKRAEKARLNEELQAQIAALQAQLK